MFSNYPFIFLPLIVLNMVKLVTLNTAKIKKLIYKIDEFTFW